jgi:hypothetical protein
MDNNKSFFEEELIRRSETVIHLRYHHDICATLQDEESIKQKIKNEDLAFYKQLLKRPDITFSFGDKFFAPVTENLLICIPKNADTSQILGLLKDKEWSKEIEKFYKEFLKAGKFQGYFDISKQST